MWSLVSFGLVAGALKGEQNSKMKRYRHYFSVADCVANDLSYLQVGFAIFCKLNGMPLYVFLSELDNLHGVNRSMNGVIGTTTINNNMTQWKSCI